MNQTATELAAALADDDGSIRLQAALSAGSNPQSDLIPSLITRCAIETDFYVRDMLTWALTRFSPELTVPRLLNELNSELAQARSQALHTLSKIQDKRAWSAITLSLLHEANDEVAQSAWRAAVVLVPEDQKMNLAEDLAKQFGRGNREVQLSLSRALITLGASVIEPILKTAMASKKFHVQAHATATNKLLRDPDAGFQLGVDQVKRMLAPGDS